MLIKRQHRHHAPSRRILLIFLGFSLMMLAVVLNLGAIQLAKSHLIIRNIPYGPQSGSSARALTKRGQVLDRNGRLLALDTVSYTLYAHPQYYREFSIAEIAEAIQPFLKLPVDEITRRMTPKSSDETTLLLARSLAPSTLEAMRKGIPMRVRDEKTGEWKRVKKTPMELGLDAELRPNRRYPHKTLAAHILGYVNDDAEIQSGVEATALSMLTIDDGKKKPASKDAVLTLDADNHPINASLTAIRRYMEQLKNHDLTLTLDAHLQFIAESRLREGVERHKAAAGTAIIMEPRSGEILAFASYPTFDPNHFRSASPTQLKNWALSDIYPPGSTIKMLTVAIGLDSGVVGENDKILDTGRRKIAGWEIRNYDYSKRPHPGMISLVDLLHHSSNIASADIALRIPPTTYHEYLSMLGFGKATGIELGEAEGLLDKPNNWDPSRRATMGFGYGLSATPLQMLAAVNTLANQGVWVQPHIIKHPRQDAVKAHRVFTTQTAASMSRLLTESIAANKDGPANIPELQVAGKTGTSRKPLANGRGYSSQLYTSFIGFFPAKRPEMIVLVVVDSPQGEAWGNTVAAPIFRQIALDAHRYVKQQPQTLRSAQAVALPATPKAR